MTYYFWLGKDAEPMHYTWRVPKDYYDETIGRDEVNNAAGRENGNGDKSGS